MTFGEFRNALCILASIDEHELVEVGALGGRWTWQSFTHDPFRFIVRCDDERAVKIWSIVERRQPSERAPVEKVMSSIVRDIRNQNGLDP